MREPSTEIANKQIRLVTNVGMVGNIVLSVLKVFVGTMAGSMSLIADGIHSLSDVATDLVVLLGIHLGSRQPDESHPYGHGRLETLSAVIVGSVLAIVGAAMIYRGGMDIAAGKVVKANDFVLLVASISIVAKELLYRMSKKVAIKWHSPVLYANAWHHRSDAFSSVAVVVGFVSLRLGFVYGDQIAAVAVGLMIVLVAIRIVGDCVRELTEGAIDSETVAHIKQIVNSNNQIRQWHKLRTRMVGREVFVDLHILVDPELNVAAAHDIAEDLEKAMEGEITRPVNIIIHVEPDIPALRR